MNVIKFHFCFRGQGIFSLVMIAVSLLFQWASSYSAPSDENPTTATSHAEARNVRTQLGHEAAMPLYQALLQKDNVTASSRLAAAPDTPLRHDVACPFWETSKIQQLRQLLDRSHYNHLSIENMFGIESPKSLQANGPLYLKPPMAGASSASPLQGKDAASSLECLVTLFLLGIAVPRKILEESLKGGNDSIALLEELGLAFSCQMDPQLVVPHVHLFPLDVSVASHNDQEQEIATLILVTDLHPRVLSTTTVGTRGHGAVMYIGPDSLALVQHHLEFQTQKQWRHSQDNTTVLDLCSGSGIQALSTLFALQKLEPHATAICVDCNERALRFTKFNAKLNGMGERVNVLWGDLITGECGRVLLKHNSDIVLTDGSGVTESLAKVLLEQTRNCRFDIVLANPPFIPVPPQHDDIAQRYGLFSSGGTDGEQVLRGIVELSSKVLKPREGLMAVVSEFMNPPQSDITNGGSNVDNPEDAALLHRIKQWWSTSLSPAGRGVLFTNQHPVNAETYASRRADTRDEFEVWLQHLSTLGFTHVSPGLLFVYTAQDESRTAKEDTERLVLHHRLVPKTTCGSIWTPSNVEAVAFTRKALNDLL